ncbi:hypothetical protein Pelo_7999 [Pelomyxa schiedti]|nr:hypothetical protein Pelo_7999 [Pelomyxa schiedti]
MAASSTDVVAGVYRSVQRLVSPEPSSPDPSSPPPLRVFVDTYGLRPSEWLTELQHTLENMGGVKLEDNKYNAEIIVRPVPVDVAPQQLVSVRGMGGQYSRTEIDDLCGLDTRGSCSALSLFF